MLGKAPSVFGSPVSVFDRIVETASDLPKRGEALCAGEDVMHATTEGWLIRAHVVDGMIPYTTIDMDDADNYGSTCGARSDSPYEHAVAVLMSVRDNRRV